MLSICLCSFNDLEYLKILYRGLKRNTKLPWEFIVHDNGSSDGTSEWLEGLGVKYSKGSFNEGAGAVNYAVNNAKYDYIVDINSDMYPLPGWDVEIYKQINVFKKYKIDKFTISSCLIEPHGNNEEYTIMNFGHDYLRFNEDGLLRFFLENKEKRKNVIQYSHPITIPKTMWEQFGGVDMNYKYGISSDHDIPASAYYKCGCRNFVMLGNSRVYHFISKSIYRVDNAEQRMKIGDETRLFFKNKWNQSIEDFRNMINLKKEFKINNT